MTMTNDYVITQKGNLSAVREEHLFITSGYSQISSLPSQVHFSLEIFVSLFHFEDHSSL